MVFLLDNPHLDKRFQRLTRYPLWECLVFGQSRLRRYHQAPGMRCGPTSSDTPLRSRNIPLQVEIARVDKPALSHDLAMEFSRLVRVVGFFFRAVTLRMMDDDLKVFLLLIDQLKSTRHEVNLLDSDISLAIDNHL